LEHLLATTPQVTAAHPFDNPSRPVAPDATPNAARPEAFSFPVRQASGIVDALNAWIAARPKDEYLNIHI